MSSDIDRMTLDEQIGQLIVVGFKGTAASQEIIDLISNYHVGGIILFSRNVQNTRQLLELTNGLQAVAKAAGHRYPLLISTDQENGMVRRLGQGTTIFPGNMALGAIGSEQIVHDITDAAGRELKSLGINMNLAPVVDVNNNPANPVIGVRSFGEDPYQVARLAAAAVRGYHAAGVITCLKHFPGHGDTAVDSHLALPIVPYTRERLEEVELVPFKGGIEAGTDSVMITHIYFPSIQQVEVHLANTQALPATVSPAIVQGLLREKMGFNGVIVSDCMEMSAVSKTIGTERGTLMALQAGIDLVFISHLYERQVGSIAAVRSAVHSGQLLSETVRQAVERVLRLKACYLSWDDLPGPTVPTWIGGEKQHQLSEQAYEMSVTLLRNDEALLPIRLESSERLLVLYPRGEASSLVEDNSYPEEGLIKSIRRHHPNLTAKAFSLRPMEDERKKMLQEAIGADRIIMVTLNAHLYQQQAELMQLLLHSGQGIIGVAVGNPYDLLAFPQLRTYLVTYEYTSPALEVAVRVLFSELQPQGRLPVSLPGLYPIGYSKTIEESPYETG